MLGEACQKGSKTQGIDQICTNNISDLEDAGDRHDSGSPLVPLTAHESGFHASDLDGVGKVVACQPPK